MGEQTTPDVDELPPSQYLVMEVLAARYRLGEPHWPFLNRMRGTLSALEEKQLIIAWPDGTGAAMQAKLTPAGEKAMRLDKPYRLAPSLRNLTVATDRDGVVWLRQADGERGWMRARVVLAEDTLTEGEAEERGIRPFPTPEAAPAQPGDGGRQIALRDAALAARASAAARAFPGTPDTFDAGIRAARRAIETLMEAQ